MVRLILIFVGGGLGSLLRYSVQLWLGKLAPAFPAGTLLVNIVGCLAIGFLGGLFAGPRPIHGDWRLAILTGLLGGFTTFSAFGWETIELGSQRQYLLAGLYVVLSVGVGLAAVWLGRLTVQMAYGS